jgi:hypothetical protein
MTGFNLPPGVTANDIPGNEAEGPALGHHTHRGIAFEIVSEPMRYGRRRAVAWKRDGDEGHGYTKEIAKAKDADRVDEELIKLAWDHARAAIDRMRDAKV